MYWCLNTVSITMKCTCVHARTHTQTHHNTSHHHVGRKPLNEGGGCLKALSRQICAWNSGLLTTGSPNPIKPHPGMVVGGGVPSPPSSWGLPLPSLRTESSVCVPSWPPTCPLCFSKEPFRRGEPLSTHFYPLPSGLHLSQQASSRHCPLGCSLAWAETTATPDQWTGLWPQPRSPAPDCDR